MTQHQALVAVIVATTLLPAFGYLALRRISEGAGCGCSSLLAIMAAITLLPAHYGYLDAASYPVLAFAAWAIWLIRLVFALLVAIVPESKNKTKDAGGAEKPELPDSVEIRSGAHDVQDGGPCPSDAMAEAPRGDEAWCARPAPENGVCADCGTRLDAIGSREVAIDGRRYLRCESCGTHYLVQ